MDDDLKKALQAHEDVLDCIDEAIEKARKPRLGSGKRFKQLTGKLKKRGAKDPKALAAWIGRKKFGSKKFSKLSQHGK